MQFPFQILDHQAYAGQVLQEFARFPAYFVRYFLARGLAAVEVSTAEVQAMHDVRMGADSIKCLGSCENLLFVSTGESVALRGVFRRGIGHVLDQTGAFLHFAGQ